MKRNKKGKEGRKEGRDKCIRRRIFIINEWLRKEVSSSSVSAIYSAFVYFCILFDSSALNNN